MCSSDWWKFRWAHIRRRIIEESCKASKIENIQSLKRELDEINGLYKEYLFRKSIYSVEGDTFYESLNATLDAMFEILKDSRSTKQFQHRQFQNLCGSLRKLVKEDYCSYSDDFLNNYFYPPVKASFQFSDYSIANCPLSSGGSSENINFLQSFSLFYPISIFPGTSFCILFQ